MTLPAAPSTRFAIPEGMGICPPSAAPAALVTPVTSASPTLCPVVAAPMTPAAAWTTALASAPPAGMLSAMMLPAMSAKDLCSTTPVIASAAMLAAIDTRGPPGSALSAPAIKASVMLFPSASARPTPIAALNPSPMPGMKDTPICTS